jgi:Cu+-exporting ATPase
MKVKDPVCGMTVEDSDASAVSTYKGTTYYFCSKSCKEDFDNDPETYIGTKAGPALEVEEQNSREMFTCPMHPEVRQPRRGACPKCGMALEPVSPPSPSSKTEWTCPANDECLPCR